MVIGKLLRADRQCEPGGGGSLRAGLRGPVPGGDGAKTSKGFQEPSFLAGFSVEPNATTAKSSKRLFGDSLLEHTCPKGISTTRLSSVPVGPDTSGAGAGEPREPPAPLIFWKRADWKKRLWQFVRARLWYALPPAACLWLTACNCFPGGSRAVSIQQPQAFAISATNPDADVNLTILTYNVWGLPTWLNHAPKVRYARIAGEIERLHPDVALLQEVWTKSAAAVAPTNGGWCVAQAPSANFFRRNGLMVLSRLPITAGEFHAFRKAAFPDSMVRKGALKVTAQAPGGQRLNIWNVHLQSDAPRVRRQQIEQLVAWVREADDGQDADIVGGDFNSTPDSAEFKLLSRELGQTVHEVARLPFAPTFDGLSPDPKMAQTFDYVFIRPRIPFRKLEAAPEITFTNANRRERFSDHVALEANVRFHAASFFASASLTNDASRQGIAGSLHATAAGY